MHTWIRRRLSYANVTATAALVLAMSGGAFAATRYLINSTRQINPKVLAKLRGRTGRTGRTGPPGPVGPKGARGAGGAKGAKGATGAIGSPGAPGQSALSPLASGQTESGDYGIRTPGSATSGYLDQAVTFPVALAAKIAAESVIYTSVGAPVTHCAGPGQADRGFLCLYSASRASVNVPPGISEFEDSAMTKGAGRLGFTIEWSVTAGEAFDRGTYTVTAP